MANDTRSRMLEATGRLLRQRGYHGTSLNDILAASGAPRGSLYFHFPGGKDQLVIEVTRASVREVAERLGETLGAEKSPAVAVRRIVDATAEMLENSDYALGCPVAPVVLDATTDIPELVELCRAAFEEWIGLLRKSFVERRHSGQARPLAGAAGRGLDRGDDGHRPRHPRLSPDARCRRRTGRAAGSGRAGDGGEQLLIGRPVSCAYCRSSPRSRRTNATDTIAFGLGVASIGWFSVANGGVSIS